MTKLLNSQHINSLRFADDIALIAESESDLQTIVNAVHQTSPNFGLNINILKSKSSEGVIRRSTSKLMANFSKKNSSTLMEPLANQVPIQMMSSTG